MTVSEQMQALAREVSNVLLYEDEDAGEFLGLEIRRSAEHPEVWEIILGAEVEGQEHTFLTTIGPDGVPETWEV